MREHTESGLRCEHGGKTSCMHRFSDHLCVSGGAGALIGNPGFRLPVMVSSAASPVSPKWSGFHPLGVWSKRLGSSQNGGLIAQQAVFSLATALIEGGRFDELGGTIKNQTDRVWALFPPSSTSFL